MYGPSTIGRSWERDRPRKRWWTQLRGRRRREIDRAVDDAVTGLRCYIESVEQERDEALRRVAELESLLYPEERR